MTDERARVPLALVGVVLLVSSAALSASLAPATPVERPAVDRTVERAEAAATTALRQAVRDAAQAAAANPVITPAATPAGEVLNDSEPFLDALRVRIALAVRQRASAVTARRDGTVATLSLPPVRSIAALERAKRAVHVSAAGPNGTAIRVSVDGLRVTARRGERVVGRSAVDASVVVATPVLSLHRRTQAFADRLDGTPLEPGLARRLSARLYPMAWARGGAQYHGAPIANVLGNRHIEVATNGAVLAEQRRAFGRSDPRARGAHRAAAAELGVRDLMAAVPRGGEWVDRVLGAGAPSGARPNSPVRKTGDADPLAVSVNATADRAFVDLLDDDGIEDRISDAYTAGVRLRVEATTSSPEPQPRPARPGPDWERLGTDRSRDVVSVDRFDVGTVRPAGDWHHLSAQGRVVTVRTTVEARWRQDERHRVTTATARRDHRVRLYVEGNHATVTDLPVRPVASIHERGGVLQGPNLAGAADLAAVELFVEGTSADRAAREAALGGSPAERGTIEGAPPEGLDRWVYSDLADLRERVRAIEVSVPRAALGTFEANPARRLAEAVAARRDSLVDAPAVYDGLADRARVAARQAYVERVLERLRERAARRDRTAAAFDGALSTADAGDAALFRAARGQDPADPERRRSAGIGGRLRLSVDAGPPYLTLAGVEGADARSVADGATAHPLVARNVNVFTVPYGDAADAILGAGEQAASAGLHAVSQALRAARRTLASGGEDSLERQRRRLAEGVGNATGDLRVVAVQTLDDRGLGRNWSDRYAAVGTALARWDEPAPRAAAAANGSLADAIAAASARRFENVSTRPERDRLAVRLRVALTDGRANVTAPKRSRLASLVDRLQTVGSRRLRTQVEDAVNASVRELRGRLGRVGTALNAVPSGLPLAPIPGLWYATVNAWYVDVRGQYQRFAVTAGRGRPDNPGATITYVRDGDAVRLDVDRDGVAERLGTATRLRFRAQTGITVVVPPGGSGVGDRDGNADERSPGWPDPGRE